MTITDDKSVSRKHANITFPTRFSPLLTDFGSKFGTFINGDRIAGSATVKSGDKIKFGGATSEYLLELKDFSVFLKTERPNYLANLKEIGQRFGFDVRVKDVSEAAYFILDSEDIDADLIEALLLGKYIVSPAYFSQLEQTDSNGHGFSLALIQPSISSRKVPLDCWIPQKSRLATFKTIFEGIKGFVLIDGNYSHLIESVKVVGMLLGIDIKILSEFSNIKFNELLIFSKNNCTNLAEQIANPVRILYFESVVDALLKNEGQLIEMQTVYPLNKSADAKSESVVEPKRIVPAETETVILEPIYNGRSLTAVIPIPSEFLREKPSQSAISLHAPASKLPKFVKCHPRHRPPGTIPALIGPDQLEPSTRRPALTPTSPQSSNTLKRRLLVKDSWLAEDDFSETEIKKGTERTLSVKENTALFNTQATKAALLSSNTEANTNNPINSVLASAEKSSSFHLQTPISHASIQSNSTASSKFQSSFFRNLSNNK